MYISSVDTIYLLGGQIPENENLESFAVVFRGTHEDNLAGLGFLLRDLIRDFPGTQLCYSSLLNSKAPLFQGWCMAKYQASVEHTLYAISLSIMQSLIKVAPEEWMGEVLRLPQG